MTTDSMNPRIQKMVESAAMGKSWLGLAVPVCRGDILSPVCREMLGKNVGTGYPHDGGDYKSQPRKLLRSLAEKNSGYCFEQDLEVQPERPVVDVS